MILLNFSRTILDKIRSFFGKIGARVLEEYGLLTLFVPGYFIPTFDRGCGDLRTPDKILFFQTLTQQKMSLKQYIQLI